MLPSDQITQIKQQLIQQIESTFPEDKKSQAIEQINSMNEEQLEQFLIQNNLIKDSTPNSQPSTTQGATQCIFCAIGSGQSKSFQIDSNSDAIAVLELNPISAGHTLIIPKQHITKESDISEKTIELAKKVSDKIQKTLKPKKVETKNSSMFGHEIINILPIYNSETFESPRKQETPENLEALQQQLLNSNEPEIIEKKEIKKITPEKLWLPKRLP